MRFLRIWFMVMLIGGLLVGAVACTIALLHYLALAYGFDIIFAIVTFIVVTFFISIAIHQEG